MTLDEEAYLRLMRTVRRITLAVEAVVQQGNAHLHWHIAPLPPGTPYEQQQYHALMTENGVIPWSAQQSLDLADRLRAALAKIGGDK
ncbi:hypothetical protein [Microtetraspora malaysiensis]|uniref:hypothetical protein n=1 Tax=Microtetraspora malaysiensis TaxID=161358 RepID=UPI003D906D17